MNYKTKRFLLLLTHLMMCFVAVFCGNMRQNWSDLDLAALEEEWKSGDNKEDFEVTPDEELYQEFERRRKMAFAKVNAATNKANKIPKSHLNRLLIKAQTAGKPEIRNSMGDRGCWVRLHEIFESMSQRHGVCLS